MARSRFLSRPAGYTLNLSADQFPIANGPYNLALNVKVENYETKSGAADWSNGGKGEVEIKNGGTNLLTAAEGSTALAEDTDGYVHYSFDLGDSPSQLVFGFCFGLGDLSIADLVIRGRSCCPYSRKTVFQTHPFRDKTRYRCNSTDRSPEMRQLRPAGRSRPAAPAAVEQGFR